MKKRPVAYASNCLCLHCCSPVQPLHGTLSGHLNLDLDEAKSTRNVGQISAHERKVIDVECTLNFAKLRTEVSTAVRKLKHLCALRSVLFYHLLNV